MREMKGTSKWALPWLRSTRTAAATGVALCAFRMSIDSWTRPPRVTTSSTMRTRSLGLILKPRRRTSLLSCFSGKMKRLSSWRATSCPMTRAPIAGAKTVSHSISPSFWISNSAKRVTTFKFSPTRAHWKKWALWSPDRRTKWPRCRAPQDSKISVTSLSIEFVVSMVIKGVEEEGNVKGCCKVSFEASASSSAQPRSYSPPGPRTRIEDPGPAYCCSSLVI